jgi:hypothetical protein
MRSLLVACGTIMFSHTVMADPQPTLCAKFGEKVFKEQAAPNRAASFTSKYDEAKNRCYVMMTYADAKENTMNIGLFDRGGVIAFCSKDFQFINAQQVVPPFGCNYIANIMKDSTISNNK